MLWIGHAESWRERYVQLRRFSIDEREDTCNYGVFLSRFFYWNRALFQAAFFKKKNKKNNPSQYSRRSATHGRRKGNTKSRAGTRPAGVFFHRRTGSVQSSRATFDRAERRILSQTCTLQRARCPPCSDGLPACQVQTRLYSFKFACKMVSRTAANTKRMFSVSVAQVKWL